MPFTTKLPDEVRQAVLDDYRAGVLGNTAIAVKHGVPRSTVTMWAHRAGLTTPRVLKPKVYARDPDESPNVLDERRGRWVQGKHGIQRWEAYPRSVRRAS